MYEVRIESFGNTLRLLGKNFLQQFVRKRLPLRKFNVPNVIAISVLGKGFQDHSKTSQVKNFVGVRGIGGKKGVIFFNRPQ